MSDPTTPKTQAQDPLERLPESASWDDIMYALYVRENIEAGLADIAAGRTFSHEEVMRRMRGLIQRDWE